ncbi:MAG: RNA polymerase sigma factor [Actinomycetota bacterium]
MDFESLYRREIAAVWRYARARVPNSLEAQDLVAETFARALEAWSGYDPARGTRGAWLFGIARNTVADFLRGRASAGGSRETPVETERLDTESAPPDKALYEEETLSELRLGIEGLSDRERDALALRFGAGLRASELGEVLGITEAAAKMLAHRAVQKLRGVMTHGGRS